MNLLAIPILAFCSFQTLAAAQTHPPFAVRVLVESEAGDDLRPARKRSVRPTPVPLGASSILFFGAHPDDELLAAPLLGEACAALRVPCTLLSVTRGERGECLRPEGCSPSLADVRTAELDASALLLGMKLAIGDLPDGSHADPAQVLRRWSAFVGDREQLVAAVARELEKSGADVVITFNPSHGSTGHPDHKAVGELLLAAARLLGNSAPSIYFMEMIVTVSSGGTDVLFEPSAEAEIRFDATPPITFTRIPRWEMALFVAQLHRSQFSTALVSALAMQPEEKRVVWLSGPH